MSEEYERIGKRVRTTAYQRSRGVYSPNIGEQVAQDDRAVLHAAIGAVLAKLDGAPMIPQVAIRSAIEDALETGS